MFCDSTEVIVHRSNTRMGLLAIIVNDDHDDTLSFSIYSGHLKRSRENLINAVDIVDLDNSKVGQGEGGVQPAVRVHHSVRHPLDTNACGHGDCDDDQD